MDALFFGWDEGGLEVDLDDAIIIYYPLIWLSVIVSINGLSVFMMLLVVICMLFAQKLGNSLRNDGAARQYQEA